MNPPIQLDSKACRRGVALVVVLAFVVLLTGLIVACFSRSLTDRKLSNSSFNQAKVDALAKSAADIIVGDLKQEIANGSDVTTVGGVSIYSPATAANMIPARSGNPPAVAGTDPIPNLVRRSVRSDPIASPGVPSRASAVNSTTDVSANGRSISLDRWNSHYLIPRHDTGTKVDSTPVSPVPAPYGPGDTTGFTAPDWVYVTNQGPQVITAPNANVVGRYAYAIYDEGGLLDVNVAGYPSASTASQYGAKGVLAYADLTKVGLSQSAVDDLTGWRNYASMQPSGIFGNFTSTATNATNYFKAVTTNPSGFMKVNNTVWNDRTDQMFMSRQELLAMRTSLGFSQNALQYLGTFSRELNAPSWGPTQNASDLGGTPGGSFDYKTNRDNAAAINRFVPNVRFASSGNITSYRNDGSSYTYRVNSGEPLVQRRFPLGRLNWIGPAGPQNGGTPASIQACFGLVWDSARGIWKYVGASGWTEQSSIKKLSDIAAEATAREPNFFELLQAGILSGSLGQELHRSVGGASNTFSYWTDPQMSAVLNIFRIGASILSQYDATCCPIVVEFASPVNRPWQACGIDNLPYLNMFHCLAGADAASPTDNIASYLVFGLWNPHQTPQGTTVTRPQVRLHMQGQVTLADNYGRHMKGVAPFPTRSHSMDGTTPTLPYSINVPLNTTIPLTSSGVDGFVDPHALLPNDLDLARQPPSSASGMMWTTLPLVGGAGGTAYAGYRLPNFLIDPTDTGLLESLNDNTATLGPLPVDLWAWFWFAVNTDDANPFNFWLEYLKPKPVASEPDVWVPYSYHANINDSDYWFSNRPGFVAMSLTQSCNGDGVTPKTPVLAPLDPPPGSSTWPRTPWITADPRSLRYNYTQGQTTNNSPGWASYLGGSIWSSDTEPTQQAFGMPGRQIYPKYLSPYNPATLCRNNYAPPPGTITTQAAYPDPDGIQRIGDSGLFASAPNTVDSDGKIRWRGDPFAKSTGNLTANPQSLARISDRPVVLNRPFTSVGDLGYVPRDYPWRTLDFFTAKSADAGLLDLFTVADTDGSMVAGRVSLNSRNTAVLTAVLAGATGDVVGGAALSKASTVAADLAKLTALTPLTGRAEIATKFVSGLTASDFTTGVTNTDEQNVKSRREGVTRALADVGQTRTWNLLIDVIAQSGRYPQGATSLDKFVVEGERRFWLHVAIDRFTGEVIDQQLEPVLQ